MTTPQGHNGHEQGSDPSQLADVSGEHVDVSRSTVSSVTAASASLNQAAARSVRAQQVDVRESAILLVQAEDAAIEETAVAAVVGREVRVNDSQVLFLLSPRVSGNINAVFTPASAFALGLGLVMGRQLLRALRRR